ncbi:MAG: glutamine--fructose-6-phosphate transaminase (isomerizing) [Clostridiales bacterium]|nr:glutamine--fructose-6-phosphate transaminase (isomerizing) [Clostridiales bacterium]
MCGITGYTGKENALPILMEGLKKLEYRGYDSAGVAIFDEGNIKVIKTRGRLTVLEDKLNGLTISTTCGIGHTRWATHGEPTDENSHPHLSNNGRFAVVHNGIIENYRELKEKLTGKGYVFLSDTDTEVIAHLIDYYYNGDIVEALIKVRTKIRGSYALGILNSELPGEIIAARKDSPLIAGTSEDGNFIASDIPAILSYTRDYYIIGDDEIARIRPEGIEIFNSDYELVPKSPLRVDWSVESAEKCGYKHFMLKEIHEQPRALINTVSPRVSDDCGIDLEINVTPEFLTDINRIHIMACGSAAHVGQVGKYIIERLARIPVECDLASEFRYRFPILKKNDLCIVISQSGETADTLAALREAKRRGVRVLSIVNVVGSTIARESDEVLYTWAGPEIAVATTKAYSTQLSLVYLIAVHIAKTRGEISDSDARRLVSEIKELPEKLNQVLAKTAELQYLSSRFYNLRDIFFIGRGVDFAVALEGSLKLKEISYIRSEAYAAGELKHGTIALIEEGSLVIALVTQTALAEKMLGNIREVKARGARVLTIATQATAEAVSEASDYCLMLPCCYDMFTPSLTVAALQLFAYYIAAARGCDVDKPKNLAKSVTVE